MRPNPLSPAPTDSAACSAASACFSALCCSSWDLCCASAALRCSASSAAVAIAAFRFSSSSAASSAASLRCTASRVASVSAALRRSSSSTTCSGPLLLLFGRVVALAEVFFFLVELVFAGGGSTGLPPSCSPCWIMVSLSVSILDLLHWLQLFGGVRFFFASSRDLPLRSLKLHCCAVQCSGTPCGCSGQSCAQKI